MEWTISLGTAVGPEHRQRAEKYRDELAQNPSLQGVWIAEEETKTQVYYGHYKGPSDPKAREEMAMLRKMQTEREIQPATLMLVPTSVRLAGAMPDYDLVGAASKGYCSLQIGYYNEGYGKEYRKAAEQAVAELRKEGLEAYYYHGPNGISSITVGVFPAESAITTPQGEVRVVNPVVLELQEKYPINTVNAVPGRAPPSDAGEKQAAKPQPSFLIRMPER